VRKVVPALRGAAAMAAKRQPSQRGAL
jgi:hypothetical protein